MKRLLVAAVGVSASLLANTAEGKTRDMVTTWYQCCNGHTASGYPFQASDPTIAAHRSLPFGTRLLLAYRGRTLCVVVRDRGPFVEGKHLDVTRAAAERLGFKEQGVATLKTTENGC